MQRHNVDTASGDLTFKSTGRRQGEASPSILSVRIDPLNFPQVMEKVRAFLSEERLHIVATVNPEFVVAAQHDEEFRYILNHTDLNVLDGTGVQLALRIIHRTPCERVTGVDLTRALAQLAAEKGYSIFFLGAAEGVARLAAERLKEQFPALRVAGCYSGTPGERGLTARINATHADILLVAYGAPKQEKFIFRNADDLRVKIAMGVGGTFDYIAGVVPYAPHWMRRAGLEWLYRLYRQPQRIGRIYKATVLFPGAVLTNKLWQLASSNRMSHGTKV